MLNWYELRFGKYQGKTLPHIVLIDPCWFIWAYRDERIFNKSWKPLRKQADYVYERSCNIYTPNNPNGTKVIHYLFNIHGGLINHFLFSTLATESH